MNTQARTAAEAMYRALSNLPCVCQHNVPYAGGQVARKVTVECARCKAMRQWEASQLEEVA